MQRPVRERRRLVRKHLARVCQLDAMVVSPVMMDVLVTEDDEELDPQSARLMQQYQFLRGLTFKAHVFQP